LKRKIQRLEQRQASLQDEHRLIMEEKTKELEEVTQELKR
jgi:hypothetical protein